MESEPEEDDSLDDSWIVEFKKTHNLYNDYCKDDLYYTNLHFVYVNKDNEIEKIKQDSFLMSTCNSISRPEIVGLIKRNCIENNLNYSIISILRYNITLDVEDINKFMKNNNSEMFNSYLVPIKNIDTITFEKTINMFQDLNDLFFLFYEKEKDKDNTGKTSSQHNSHNSHNSTKRVFFKPHAAKKHKKTHRKY